MSVVAFRDGTMAADTSGECNDRRLPGTKLLTNGTIIVGMAGDDADAQRAARWVLDGADPAKPIVWFPWESGSWKPNFGLLVWDTHSLTYWGSTFVPAPVIPVVRGRGLFYAIGCGAEAALGAMHMGATAEEAVRVAMHVNVGVWGDVETMKLP